MNDIKFNALQKKLVSILNSKDLIQEAFGIEEDEATEMLADHVKYKDQAILGNKDARAYIINQYSRVLGYLGINNYADMTGLIDFQDIQNNDIDIIFEILLGVFDISDLFTLYGIPEIVTEDMVRAVAKAELRRIEGYYASFAAQLLLLATIFYAKEYGQDCMDSLQHHNINEIGVLDKDYIYIMYKGSKVYLEFLKFPSSSTILKIQKKVVINSSYNYDEKNPSLTTAKLNSSRITVAGYSITPTPDDLYYNERIFNLEKITLEEMRDSYGTINQDIYNFLCFNQQGRGSYVITGPDMGVGKSTFLLAMVEKIPQKWGIGILDSQNELQAHKKYPEKNILTTIESENRSIAQCFEYMLKTSRDVLLVSEITKPAEVSEMINASLRLNAGVGATLHSLSPDEVIVNARNLLMRTDMYNDAQLAEADLARGLDLIINLIKLDGGRIVVNSIDEIMFVEREIWFEPSLGMDVNSKLLNILNMAEIALSKYLYQKKYRLNRLFEYDQATDTWQITGTPSDTYYKKMRIHAKEI